MITKFPNPHHIVMEIGHDVPNRDRDPREERITRYSIDMRGATGGANNNLQSRGVYIGEGGKQCQIEVTCAGIGNGSGRFW